MNNLRKSSHFYLLGLALFLSLMVFGFKTVQASDHLIFYTFNPTDDSFVAGNIPWSNQGQALLLKTKGSDMESYLRFNVQDLAGYVLTATLRLNVDSNNGSGFAIYLVPDNSWQEDTITYNNAPALGDLIYSTGAYTSGTAVPGTWVEIDVTPYVQADGVYNFAIVGTDDRVLSFSSRDGGFSPELYIIDPPQCGNIVCPGSAGGE